MSRLVISSVSPEGTGGGSASADPPTGGVPKGTPPTSGSSSPPSIRADQLKISSLSTEEDDKTIAIILDTTGSMRPSLDACKLAIAKICTLIKSTRIKVVICLYGDYDSKRRKPHEVVTVLQGDIDKISTQLEHYKLNSNGVGGDIPEALTTAANVVNDLIPQNSLVIIITDAVYHRENRHGDYNYTVEHKALVECGYNPHFTEVIRAMHEKNIIFDVITSYRDHREVYSMCDGVVYKRQLTLDFVTRSLLLVINNRLGSGKLPESYDPNVVYEIQEPIKRVNYNTRGLHTEHYYNMFSQFIKDNPNLFYYLAFLAQPYFEMVRKLKKYDDHSQLCEMLSKSGVDSSIIKWFKDEGAVKMTLSSINDGIQCDIFLSASESIDYNALTEIFSNFTYDKTKQHYIGKLKDAIKGLKSSPTDETFDPSRHIYLSVIGKDTKLIQSFLCKSGDGTLNEFGSFHPIMASAILQWCEIPELVDIVRKHICLPQFMKWTTGNGAVPDTMFNATVLDFIRQGLAPHKTNANKDVLDYMVKAIKASTLLDKLIPRIACTISLEQMKPKDKVKNSVGVWMAVDLLIANYFPINLMVKIDEEKFKMIVARMETYIKEFGFDNSEFFTRFGTIEAWKGYIEKVSAIVKAHGHIYVSTYAVFFGETSDVGTDYVTQDGVIDQYYFRYFVNRNPDFNEILGLSSDKLLELYNTSIGFEARNMLSENNIVFTKDILRYGPIMASCTRKYRVTSNTCGKVYMILDTSSGATLTEAQCSECRLKKDLLKMYSCKCTGCGMSIKTASSLSNFEPTCCVFCKIQPAEKDFKDVKMSKILMSNLTIFSEYLGIPEAILERLVSTQKPSRALRIDCKGVDGNKYKRFHHSLFDGDWKKRRSSLDGLVYDGCIINPASVQDVSDLIQNGFTYDCVLCCDKSQIKNTVTCKKCNFRYCIECANHMHGDEQWFNKTQGSTAYSCPACRHPIPKGLARKKKWDLLYIALANKVVANVGPSTEIRTCGDKNCTSKCRSFVVEKDQCGAGDEEDAPAEHTTIRCLECILENSQKVEEENIGVKLPTGHFVLQDGMMVRSCPICNTIGTREDNQCWSMTCANCSRHFCWHDGSTGNTYETLDQMFESCYVSRTIHVDPRNPNMFISTTEGPVDFKSWTEEQLAALETSRKYYSEKGAGIAGIVDYEEDDEDW